MKAELKWKFPNGVKQGDVYTFRMKKQVELPLISPEGSDVTTLFLEGGQVKGTPALVAMKDLESQKETVIEGVLISETGGHYVVPKSMVEKDPTIVKEVVKTAGDLIKEAGSATKEVAEDVKNFDTEKTLGFTKKQLLVMAITTFIVIKIFK